MLCLTTRHEALDHIGTTKAHAQLIAGHAWFSDPHLGGSNAKAFANHELFFKETLSGKVLPKHAPRKFRVGQFCLPVRVMLAWVAIDGLVDFYLYNHTLRITVIQRY
jgi:hypothetical protein